MGPNVRSISMFVLIFGVIGCGAEDGAESTDVSELTETVLETDLDRPPAAAGIGIQINDTRYLRVFACGDASRNVLQFTTIHTNQTPPVRWDEWTDITPNTDDARCAGTPAVGAWKGSPQDELEVFYRGLDNELREYYVDPSGRASIHNLSRLLGIGPISGDPVIADMDSTKRISVVVRLAGHKLTSLDMYSNAWHVRPVLNASGNQVIAPMTLVGHFDHVSRGFLSAQVTPSNHLVFTRSSWSSSFTQLKTAISRPPGLLTFAHVSHHSKCNPPYPCVVSRNGSEQPTIAATTGDTWSFTALPLSSSDYTFWGDGAQTGYAGAGNVYTYNLQHPGRGLFWFGVSPVDGSQGFLYGSGGTLVSGPNPVVNPGSEYAGWSVINANGNVHVFHFDQPSLDGGLQDLGLGLSTP